MSGPGQGDGPRFEFTKEALVTCPFCSTRFPLPFGPRPHDGRAIQDTFPHATPEQREMYITGLCVSCQESTFRNQE